MLAAPPAPATDVRTGRTLARLLSDAGFTHAGLAARLGRLEDAPPRRDVPVYVRRLGPPDELGVVARLLALELAVPAAEAERLVRPQLLRLLCETGLAEPDGDAYRPAARLTPHEELVVASDVHTEPPAQDFVPGAQGPSRMLAALTVRRPVERALDVGTGCGWQALLAARHARTVVATDVSRRALAYAAFNAALNGIENVELRAGSFFEPVAGELFDLVVSNPPYPISPGGEFVFRDGGLGRDGVSAHVARTLPMHLQPGGFGAVLIAWVEGGIAPRSWLTGAACDAWLFRTWSHDALAAAATWNSDEPDPREYAERVERWLAYYEREQIERIGYGCLVVRRRADGDGWFRDVALGGRPAAAGEQVERLFSAEDYLVDADDERLLAARLMRAPGAVLMRESSAGATRWSLRLEGGLGLAAALDSRTAALVEALDGRRTLARALELAAPAAVDAGLQIARGLIAGGFVTPVQ